MIKKIIVVVAVLVLALTLVVVSCTAPAPAPSPAPAPGPAPAGPVTLNYVHADSERALSYGIASVLFFTEEIERLTEGRIKFKIYPRGGLAPPPENYDLVRTGAADVGWILPGYSPGRFPLISIIGLPFAWTKFAQAPLALDLLRLKGVFDDETADVKVVGMGGQGMYHLFTSKKKINSIDDMKGLKVFRSGDYEIRAVKRLGMIPVTMDLGEAVLAIQTGVIDGIIIGYGLVRAFGFVDYIKYVTEMGIFSAPFFYAFNKDVWARISPEDQRIIEMVAVQGGIRLAYIYDLEEEVAMRDQFRQRGIEIDKLSPADMERARELTRPVWDEWVTDMEAKGYPGKDIMATFQQIREQLGVEWQPQQ